MRSQLKPVHDAMAAILADHRSSRIERILSAQIIMSLYGCLLPAVDERWLSVRQITELRRWQQRTVETVLKRKARRRLQNRRGYIRRQLRELEAQPEQNKETIENSR